MTGGDKVLDATKAAVKAVLPWRMYGPIRARRVRWLIDGYTPRTVRHQYAGFPLTVHLRDPLGEEWYRHDWEEPPEVATPVTGAGGTTRWRDLGTGLHLRGERCFVVARPVRPT
jgi:hypothetical protein